MYICAIKTTKMITVHLSDGSSQTYDEVDYYERIRIIRNMKEPNKNFHEIPIKGYYAKAFYDDGLSKKYGDINYGYGKILFKGNWDEYDEYISYLVKNEGKFGFKII